MQSKSFVRKARMAPLSLFEEILLGLFYGLFLFIVSFALFYSGLQFWYGGKVLPGVSLAGVSLEGLSLADSSEKISQTVSYPNTGHILLYDQKTQKSWNLTPAQLGLLLDPESSASAAMQIGRSANPLRSFEEQTTTWFLGQDVSPVMVYDERLANILLSQMAAQIDQPMVNASLKISGTDVIQTNAQVGRKIDIQATLLQIRHQAQSLKDIAVPLVIIEEQPTVLDVSSQAAQVRTLLSQPLTLTLPDDQPDKATTGPWVFDPPTLAAMLRFDYPLVNGKSVLRVSLSHAALLTNLNPLVTKLQQQKQNARFTFNDNTHQLDLIQHAVIGRSLDLEKNVSLIESKVLSGQHQVALQLDINKPEVTDDKTGADLGIIELVHQETSYFYGSPDERVQNIKAASKSFHGYLLGPGQTLSMADLMGDVSLDTGYAEALIIAGGKTIKGVGGGVCQVSTTLFRAAFFTGFPILERYPHAYRVGYYEYDPKGKADPQQYSGLDATVYVPQVDFKFKNDTNTWLLMETYVNPSYSTLIWKFYGTKDSRTVEWTTTGPTNVVPHPKDLYRENPDLPAGKIKKVDYAADGADVTVHRTVRKGGAVLYDDSITTHYEPWQAVYEYGPGTEGMPPPDSLTQ